MIKDNQLTIDSYDISFNWLILITDDQSIRESVWPVNNCHRFPVAIKGLFYINWLQILSYFTIKKLLGIPVGNKKEMARIAYFDDPRYGEFYFGWHYTVQGQLWPGYKHLYMSMCNVVCALHWEVWVWPVFSVYSNWSTAFSVSIIDYWLTENNGYKDWSINYFSHYWFPLIGHPKREIKNNKQLQLAWQFCAPTIPQYG